MYRVKKNKEEGADGRNISMAAGSLFLSCTTPVLAGKGRLYENCRCFLQELIHSEEKQKGNHEIDAAV